MKNYTIHRNDRETVDHKSKHGGVLVAVKNLPHERIDLKTKNEYVAIKVKPKDTVKRHYCVLLCWYVARALCVCITKLT